MSDELPEGAAEGLADFNADGLYRVEEVTDFHAGTIKVLTPIRPGGGRDNTRPLRFVSSVACAYRGQPYNVGFEIEAVSLQTAVEAWKPCAIAAAKQQIERLDSEASRQSILSAGGTPMAFKAPLKTRH